MVLTIKTWEALASDVPWKKTSGDLPPHSTTLPQAGICASVRDMAGSLN